MKHFYALLVLAALLLLAPLACNQPFSVPPSVPAPPLATPTATITPGCQSTGLNIVTGTGILGGLYSLTPVATPTWTWTGNVPPHSTGVVLIQTASDWSNYVSTSYVPTGPFPIPFDPSTQAMVVAAKTWGAYSCPNFYNISSVCNNGTQITVQVDEQQSCCGTVMGYAGFLNSSVFQAVIINTFGLPVSINQTFYPYTGPTCM